MRDLRREAALLLICLGIFMISGTVSAQNCFPYDIASITGLMNIREEPRLHSKIVGAANSGNNFHVINAEQGGHWCWIQIEVGWLANTARVQGKSLDDLYPTIRGAETQLIQSVKKALDWMKRRVPQWFDYVVNAVDVIIVEKPANVWSFWPVGGARARVTSGETFIWGFEGKRTVVLYLSSVLIHEACHHYQWREGRFHGRTRADIEAECHEIQMQIVEDVVPSPATLRTLQNDIKDAIIRE